MLLYICFSNMESTKPLRKILIISVSVLLMQSCLSVQTINFRYTRISQVVPALCGGGSCLTFALAVVMKNTNTVKAIDKTGHWQHMLCTVNALFIF